MRFAVHEGFVRSKFDGLRRLVPFKALCHLYGLNPRTCVNWAKSPNKERESDFIHLFPLYHGNYKETLYEKRRKTDEQSE